MNSIIAEVAISLGAIPAPPGSTIEIGPLTIRFYGMMIAFGVFAGVTIASRRWEARGGAGVDISSVAFWAVGAGLLGARAYHVITDIHRYRDSWLDAFKFWTPGLGIPGGLLAGVVVGILAARKKGITDINAFLAATIPGVPIAQAVGRLGNWFNQEVYGSPTNLPWALKVDPGYRPSQHLDNDTFHPTFLYEGLCNVALAVTLIWLDARRWLKPGQMVPAWIVGYGVIRFIVEGIRIDAATELAGIRVNHWVSGTAVVIGTMWFMIVELKARRSPSETETEAETETEIEIETGTEIETEIETETNQEMT